MSYIAYKKIANLRKTCKVDGKFKFVGSKTLVVFEKENGIVFSVVSSGKDSAGKVGIYTSKLFKLTIKRRKDNTYYFNFYELILRPSIVDNKQISKIVSIKITRPSFLEELFQRHASTHNRKGFAKSQKQRLYIFLKNFLKRQKISSRWLSKDPIILIMQLCYPGFTKIDEKIIKKIVPSYLFKQDIWKTVLKTNGNRSKNLLRQILEKKPLHLEHIKLIRSLYGLDKAQQFMEYLLSNNTLVFPNYGKKILTLMKRCFSGISYEKMLSIFRHTSYMVSDTLTLIEQNNGVIPEWESLQELHDNLARRNRRISDTSRSKAVVPKNKKIEELQSLWDGELELCIPETGADLIDWSETMNNCVSSYINKIVNKQYYIFGIKKNSKLIANIGFYMYLDNSFEFSQMSGPRNSVLDPSIASEIRKQFSKIEVRIP